MFKTLCRILAKQQWLCKVVLGYCKISCEASPYLFLHVLLQFANLEEMCKDWCWPKRAQPVASYQQTGTFYQGSFLKMLFHKIECMLEQVSKHHNHSLSNLPWPSPASNCRLSYMARLIQSITSGPHSFDYCQYWIVEFLTCGYMFLSLYVLRPVRQFQNVVCIPCVKFNFFATSCVHARSA
jgi:hypothetical protein